MYQVKTQLTCNPNNPSNGITPNNTQNCATNESAEVAAPRAQLSQTAFTNLKAIGSRICEAVNSAIASVNCFRGALSFSRIKLGYIKSEKIDFRKITLSEIKFLKELTGGDNKKLEEAFKWGKDSISKSTWGPLRHEQEKWEAHWLVNGLKLVEEDVNGALDGDLRKFFFQLKALANADANADANANANANAKNIEPMQSSMHSKGNEVNELRSNPPLNEATQGPTPRAPFLVRSEHQELVSRAHSTLKSQCAMGIFLLSRFKEISDNEGEKLLRELKVLQCWAAKNQQGIDEAIIWGTETFHEETCPAWRVKHRIENTELLLSKLYDAEFFLMGSTDASLKEFQGKLSNKVRVHYEKMQKLLEEKEAN